MRNPCVITDYVEAAKVLASVGLLDKLGVRPPYTHSFTVFDHQECWCLGTYDTGHPDPADNGFLVMMIPKEMATKEQAFLLFAECEAANTHGPIEQVEVRVPELVEN